jgi:hypothetical protein
MNEYSFSQVFPFDSLTYSIDHRTMMGLVPRALLFEFPATRLGHAGRFERRKSMSDSIQQETSRVLARACARTLNSDEIGRVSAGQNRTFAFHPRDYR